MSGLERLSPLMPTKEVDLQAESVLQSDKATAHEQSYVYRPLRFNEIRLLELLPRTRMVDQNCKVHCPGAAHISDAFVSFIALSFLLFYRASTISSMSIHFLNKRTWIGICTVVLSTIGRRETKVCALQNSLKHSVINGMSTAS
jgi:hypothetical protein